MGKSMIRKPFNSTKKVPAKIPCSTKNGLLSYPRSIPINNNVL
jgi:hypothetical protein